MKSLLLVGVGRVVGRDAVDGSATNTYLPQRLLLRHRSDGRLDAGGRSFLEHGVIIKPEVVGRRLRGDVHAISFRFQDDCGRGPGGELEDMNRTAGLLGERHNPTYPFDLGDDRPRTAVIER